MDTHDGTGRPPGTPSSEVVRLPYVPVALALLALIIAVTAGALYLTRHARSDAATVVEATVLPTASAPPTVVPIVAAAATPTALATATTVPTLTSTVVPIATRGTTATASGMVTGVATAATSTPLEKEIEQAYIKQWQVYRQAAMTGDTTHLSEVLDGDALKLITDEITSRKSQGRGADLRTTHTYFLRNVTADAAEVDDQYVDDSRWIDIKTGQTLPRQDPPQTFVGTFQLHKVNGVWKVVTVTRDERK